MSSYHRHVIVPRNGKILVVAIVARISGCANQKELSLKDQVDHAKQILAEYYEGPVEYRVMATKGKGERLDRPELAELEQMLRTDELDLVVLEDLGRLVRGTAAKDLCAVAVEQGARVIAPNDCIDTADENWEEDVIGACKDHVGHNAHTSKRIKHKMQNRFVKFGGSIARPIFGYILEPKTKNYDGWRKDESATPIIREGLTLLKQTGNCTQVGDLFNARSTPVGPYARRDKWDGKMIRRFYQNRILGGMVGRGFRHTVKHNETGRRISRPNPAGPCFREYPALAHADNNEIDSVQDFLKKRNQKLGRKVIDGRDPRQGTPRKRTRFLGQHGRCWYCGKHHVWGGNGMKDNLMCSGSRETQCWCTVGYNGPLAVRRVVKAISEELYKLDGIDDQFRRLVSEAGRTVADGTGIRLENLRREELKLATSRTNLMWAVAEYGPNDLFAEQLSQFRSEEARLARERRELVGLRARDLKLPKSALDIRTLFEQEMIGMAIDSFEAVPLLNRLLPEFYVYLVRLRDGRESYPRARVTLALDALTPDAVHVPGLPEMLRRVVTIDLFDPPQRERVREAATRLDDGIRTHSQIAELISEKPTTTAVQRALKLQRLVTAQGLASPYVLVENPTEINSLPRYKNAKYVFIALPGYQQPKLV